MSGASSFFWAVEAFDVAPGMFPAHFSSDLVLNHVNLALY